MTRVLLAAMLVLAVNVHDLLLRAFYPALLLLLVAASLGVPLPEDVPLIAAGVILYHHPEMATWPGTLSLALLGIMCGDVILYVLGSRWGPEVLSHRYTRRVMSPKRFSKMVDLFDRYGIWMCFFARFFMGIRAAMCVTAGVMRFPFWRFLLADLAGALISVPLFVWLGYWFANMIPRLKAYVHLVQLGILVIAVIAIGVFVIRYRKTKPLAPEELPLPESVLRAAGRRAPVAESASPPAGKAPPAEPASDKTVDKEERAQAILQDDHVL